MTIQPTVQLDVNMAPFNSMLARWAGFFGKNLKEAIKFQGKLLCQQLIAFTPPKNRTQGTKRVERDIRKVIKGVKGAMNRPEDITTTIVSQTNPRSARHSNELEWGIRQKVEGKEAIRIYADKHGNVYGIDAKRYMPGASHQTLAETHQQHRISRGRITKAAEADLITGRWRWLNMMVTEEKTVRGYIKKKQANVGRAKGGWASGVIGLGGKPAGWIARWAKMGTFVDGTSQPSPYVTFVNNSEWASGGDDDRITQNAIKAREEKMRLHMQDAAKKAYEKAAGRRPF